MSEQKPNDMGTPVNKNQGANPLPLPFQTKYRKRTFDFPPEDLRDAASIALYGHHERRHLYIIGNHDYWKIGVSQNVKYRFMSIRSDLGDKDLRLAGYYCIQSSGHKLTERYAHAVLSDKNIGGEWFQCTEQEALDAAWQAVEYQERIWGHYHRHLDRRLHTEFPQTREEIRKSIKEYLVAV